MADVILFAVFPYVAVALCVAVGLYRYFGDRFSFSSLSSQFLERRRLFWSSPVWHYAIIAVLLAHLLVALFAGLWLSIVGAVERLYVLEIIGLALGLAASVSAALFVYRRLSSPRLRLVTSPMDWVLLVDLLIQVGLGAYVAVVYRWGSVWYTASVVPWLSSLVRLDPQVSFVAVLPWIIKLHFANAFLLVALLPFTRLVHVVAFPVTYLRRLPQVVIWNRRAAMAASTSGRRRR